MEGSVVHHLRDGDVVVSGGERAVIGVDVGDQLRVVRVPPEAVRMIPGNGADHLDVVRQPVEPEIPQRGIVLKDQNQILQGIFQPAGPLEGQAALPAFVLLREIELAGCGRRAAFLQQFHPDVLVRRGELQHGFHRRQLAVGCVSGGLLVPVAEQMNPDQVKGVEQLTAGGIGGVVAVKKGIIVVHDGAGGAFPGGVGVAVLIGRGNVHLRQESFDRLADAVAPAERADDACFRAGILRLFPGSAGYALPGGSRQLCQVVPFRVRLKDRVRIQPGAFVAFEHELPVGGSGRPVHQLMRHVGAFVDIIDADILREIPGHGVVLLRADVAGQREAQPDAGILRRMAVRGVKETPVQRGRAVVRDERFRHLVAVQDYHGAAFHMVALAASAPKRAAHKAAFVLDPVADGLGGLRVFLGGLAGADRRFQPPAQIIEGRGLVDPFDGVIAVADDDLQFTHAFPPPRSPR